MPRAPIRAGICVSVRVHLHVYVCVSVFMCVRAHTRAFTATQDPYRQPHRLIILLRRGLSRCRHLQSCLWDLTEDGRIVHLFEYQTVNRHLHWPVDDLFNLHCHRHLFDDVNHLFHGHLGEGLG